MSNLLTPDVLGQVSSLTNYNGNLDKIENAFSDIGPYVVTGLVPSAGTGLSVNVTAGTALIGGRVTVSGTFAISGLTPSTTNYLFLQQNGTGASNTTGTAPSNSVRLGTALTGASTVTSVDTSITSGRQTKVAANVFLTDTNPQTLSEGVNIAVGTTTGSKIGTATTQKLGFFNATPIVQPANTTDLRTALINLGLLATGGATPLDLNAGALAAGTAAFSGVMSGSAGGAGTPFQWKSATITPPSDADYTLTAAEMSCVVLSLVAGSWTSGHSLIMPTGFAGGAWHISNTSGFTATIKPSGGTGINIANSRAAWIRTNGTNARRMTPDVDPTV